MSTLGTERVVETWRRALILAVVIAVLGLAVAADATMKRHRVAAGAAPTQAVTFVHPTASAQSTAWYCPGPLPLGLKQEHSFLVIANAATSSVGGQLLVSTSRGLSSSRSISIPPRSTTEVALAAPSQSSFGAASVLANGSGVGVEEVVDGPTGRQAAACVGRASADQYIAGGSTKGADDIALAIYDPGATPSVANVSFATSSGNVAPLEYQGLPIGAGQVVVLDVGRVVAQRDVVATLVQTTGGHVVLGAIEHAAIGNVVYPALLSANAVAESSWYLPALPAGGSSLGYLYALNPGSSETSATVRFGGTAGSATATMVVPAGGIARLTESPVASVGALRSATVSTPSSSPIVVLQSELLAHPLAQPNQPIVHVTTPTKKAAPTAGSSASGAIGRALQVPTTTAPSSAAAALSSLFGLPQSLPVGYELSPATVASEGWLLPGGESSATLGEYVSLTNPGTTPATVSLETLANGEATVIPNLGSVLLAPGASAVVDLARVLPPTDEVTLLASASAPVVVAAGLYAKGSKGSVGLSAPVAIPLD